MAKNPLIQIARGTHRVGPQLTAKQLHVAAEHHTGLWIKLPYHSELTSIKVEDDRLVMAYTQYDADMRAHETRYNGATRVLDVYTLDAGVWSRTDQFSAIDEAFQPYVSHESGRAHRDETEQRTRRIFEGDCYRPGTSKAPLDNAQRTSEGYTTKAMERHWS